MKVVHARRLLCVLLALGMLVALGATGFAEGGQPKAVKVEANSFSLPVDVVRVGIGTDGEGGSAKIKRDIRPSKADARENPKLIEWTSSNEAIAEVDKNGVVTAKALGSCKVTAKLLDGSGLFSSCGVVVGKQRVTKVALDWTKKALLPGKQLQLNTNYLPKNAYYPEFSFRTSNKKVAVVDKDGMVTAVGFGKCTISATNIKSGKRASALVRVGYEYTGVKYRYYGIVNTEYPDQVGKARYVKQPANDFGSMYKKRLSDTGFNVAKTFENLSASEMRQAIRAIANNSAIAKGDVTIFHFAGRAERYGLPQQRGALMGVDKNVDGNSITIAELQEQLDKVPGTVILVLDCDMAGRFVKRAGDADSEAFCADVVRQFSGAGGENAKAISGDTRGKYKIFCAAGSDELSLHGQDGAKAGDSAYFSYYLAKGLISGVADKNKDGNFSMAEVAGYVRKQVNAELERVLARGGKKRTQTVTLWPKGDKFPLYYSTPGTDDR